jgi:broad specificity phosphatase PhoE
VTTFFLIRHAAYGSMEERLVGRTPHLSLDARGIAQAERLAARLAGEGLNAVHASPRERTIETATPIAAHAGVPLETAAALDEIDVGEWTGLTFAELAGDLRWRAWNETRSGARAPGGESMAEVQARAVAHVEATRVAHPEGRLALVSHADVLKAVILHYLGLSLDAIHRIDMAAAGISRLVVRSWGGKLVSLNESVA